MTARAQHTLAAALLLTAVTAAVAKPAMDVSKLIKNDDAWFKSAEGQAIMANIVSWQNADGGWYKEYEPTEKRPEKVVSDGKHFGGGGAWLECSTIDNNATYSEIRLLAHANRISPNPAYVASFKKGLAYVESMQYPNGGIPQRFPLQKNYGRYITLNDDAMTNVLRLLKDIADAKPNGDFALCDAEDRAKAKAVFEKGIDCVVKMQYRQNGVPTVWCQQHDPVTLQPAGARAFELPSLCSSESSNLVMLMMEIDQPTPAVKQSIEDAVAWFNKTKITGKRWDWVSGPQYEGGKDRILIDDPKAGPVWARFYDLGTNEPFFVGRDGVKHHSVTEVPHERRIGYAWYSVMPQKVLAAYDKWKTQH
ncbi:MAG: pectate lyase [Tepidisphaeraceae bacterium]